MAATNALSPLDVYTEESRARGLYITAAHYNAATQTIHVKLKAGMTISFPKDRSQVPANATDEQLSEMRSVLPDGASISRASMMGLRLKVCCMGSSGMRRGNASGQSSKRSCRLRSALLNGRQFSLERK